MYLLDSNLFLELLLDQDKAGDVSDLLRRLPPNQLFLTDFTLYSVGIVLLRRRKPEIFFNFLEDVLLQGSLNLVRLEPEDMKILVEYSSKLKLDFDDAYQYTIASKYNLTIVSFDSDFDRTELGRKTPADILSK